MKTAEIKFLDLCDEIDYWKERASEAEANANYWKNEYSKHLNESIISTKKDVANALMFALAVRDDENGNLIIDKESRTELAKNFKE